MGGEGSDVSGLGEQTATFEEADSFLVKCGENIRKIPFEEEEVLLYFDGNVEGLPYGYFNERPVYRVSDYVDDLSNWVGATATAFVGDMYEKIEIKQEDVLEYVEKSGTGYLGVYMIVGMLLNVEAPISTRAFSFDAPGLYIIMPVGIKIDKNIVNKIPEKVLPNNILLDKRKVQTFICENLESVAVDYAFEVPLTCDNIYDFKATFNYRAVGRITYTYDGEEYVCDVNADYICSSSAILKPPQNSPYIPTGDFAFNLDYLELTEDGYLLTILVEDSSADSFIYGISFSNVKVNIDIYEYKKIDPMLLPDPEDSFPKWTGGVY